ncbi:nuclear transcription factor Y subunit C-2-like [Vigna umbellata]|uniref:nuclear transcription factor Y subunit C-2-like n=1 Tax=Vigna umbellata TaxID=87088 RepID=UPI001F5FE877|nr:nuclear transcription factor Y subunit C-2-like [Vigna umbellata]
MEQNQHGQLGRGIGSAPAQEAHNKNQYQSKPTNPPIQTAGPSVPSPYPGENHHALRSMDRQQQQQDQLEEKVKSFWAQQLKEIEESTDLRNQHRIPLSRVKKIMKSDADVKLVSAEAPVVFAKACELFIMELTMKAWANAEDNNRSTIKKSDVASAIARTDVFDFLEDIAPIPRVHKNTMMHPLLPGNAPTPTENVPHMPPPQHVASPPPPYVAAEIPHALQIYPLVPSSTVPPNQQNPSPTSDD